MRTIVVKKKYIFLVIISLLCLAVFLAMPAIKTASPLKRYTIVIDAGHGGLDVK